MLLFTKIRHEPKKIRYDLIKEAGFVNMENGLVKIIFSSVNRSQMCQFKDKGLLISIRYVELNGKT